MCFLLGVFTRSAEDNYHPQSGLLYKYCFKCLYPPLLNFLAYLLVSSRVRVSQLDNRLSELWSRREREREREREDSGVLYIYISGVGRCQKVVSIWLCCYFVIQTVITMEIKK